jgi:hypothetical protein
MTNGLQKQFSLVDAIWQNMLPASAGTGDVRCTWGIEKEEM